MLNGCYKNIAIEISILRTRRWWIWTMQLLVGAGFAAVGLCLPLPIFFKATLALFYLVAFSSATHDIAADGFYMLATTEKEQAFFVGIRSTFYRISTISGQGLLVMLAGFIQSHSGLPKVSLQVEARPGAALLQKVEPESFRAPSSMLGEMRLIAEPIQLEISPAPRSKTEINALISSARDWNTKNGFNRIQQRSKAEDKKKQEISWWKKHISGPLGEFLGRSFGPESKRKSDLAGNVGLVHLRLANAPEKPIAVTIALKTGDKSFSLAEGTRLEFGQENWNRPAVVIFQLDPKLKRGSSAIFEIRSGNIPLSWLAVFAVLVGLFLFFGVYHRFILPRPARDRPGEAGTGLAFLRQFFKTFTAFFGKNRICILLLFLLLYRFAEAQLVKMVAPFLLDGREAGGLGLTTGQVGFVYGTIGIIALTCGGVLGGMLASKSGLKFWLWPMVFIMHLPDAMFVYLAYAQPDNFVIINLCVALEQFGYGFGFTAYMLYMIYIALGQHETAHYAICTGFMALGMMLPGMFSGWLQEIIGYQHFFVWVMLATLPGFLVVAFVPLDPEFGRKTSAVSSSSSS